MKKIIYSIAVISLFFYFSANAAAQDIHIEGAKFVYPIVAKWVDEYTKENPGTQLNIKVDAETKASAATLSVVTNRVPNNEINNNDKIVYVGRYALLPVSNKNNPLLAKVKKGLKKREIQNLIFEKDVLADDADEEEVKEKYTATIYSRSGQAQTTRTLAKHFGRSAENIKGKKIIGDEIYLLSALQKDESGIAYNTLNYVYDLQTRQLKNDLTLVPLNVKQEIRDELSQDVDHTISALEGTEVETIPVEQFGIVIPAEYAQNADVLKFANWILSKGQQYNHELGFLTLDSPTLANQQKELSSIAGTANQLYSNH
jgi:ABC-type phosphate transport system substrate-binding protein